MNFVKTKKYLVNGLLLLAFVISIISCKDDNSLEQLRKNELALLDEYMAVNYPDVEPTRSGLYFIEEKKGEGDTIVRGDVVQIYYATWLIDSTLIDQSNGYIDGHRFEPYQVTVGSGSSIQGLEEALTYMQKGGVANLVINSQLAYGQDGSFGNPPVPGFTTLLMQVEVYKIVQPN
jgi:FKBP-type peptidyl-prolyl cis-trans isomerase